MGEAFDEDNTRIFEMEMGLASDGEKICAPRQDGNENESSRSKGNWVKQIANIRK